MLEAKEVLLDSSKRGAYDAVWARENAGWIAAEKLRKQREKQQQEERGRKERKLAKQMEEKQRREKEEAEKRARDRKRQQAASRAANDREAQRIAELKVKRAAHREFQEKIKAAKERKGREDSRWETRAQKKQQESKLEREARAKADKEAKIENQKWRKRVQIGSSVLVGVGFMILLNEFAGVTYAKEEQVQATWEEDGTFQASLGRLHARLAPGKGQGAVWGGGSYMYGTSPNANQQGNVLRELEKALMVESRENKEQVTENAPGGNSTPAASPTNPTKFHPK